MYNKLINLKLGVLVRFFVFVGSVFCFVVVSCLFFNEQYIKAAIHKIRQTHYVNRANSLALSESLLIHILRFG